MHELPVIEKILKVVLAHGEKHGVSRIEAIHLRVGELSDLETEWMQHYFDYLSRGTLAEGARLEVTKVPAVMRCEACAREFPAELGRGREPACPECGGSSLHLISGREYTIDHMEAI